jgi:hypothetical protein
MLFIIHINSILLGINSVPEPVLFADDTSVIISFINFEHFCSVSNIVLSRVIKWFDANNLVPNLDKTNIMKLTTKYSPHSNLHIGYKDKYVGERVNTKFLGLQAYNLIYWKDHIEQMIPKLSGAYFAVKSMVHISNINHLKSIYYAYYHSIMKYEIIFGVTLPTVGRFLIYKRKSSEF